MVANGAVELPSYRLKALEKLIFEKFPGPREHGVMKKEWIGQNAGKILQELGTRWRPGAAAGRAGRGSRG